ncbi:MAG: acyl-CoA thioesterase [Acidobacteriota bacterium]|nr:MAG: acyl-CoA thioesterase [Acidobacteriota bacterium]
MNTEHNYDWSETRIRVRYAETDQSGVVYHANYLPWFEVGRVELCRDHGFNYRDMEKQSDAILPVIDLKVTYRSPALYDDVILIRTRLKFLRTRSISFVYEVYREADMTLLAEGETYHVVVNREGRARSFPPEFAAKMRAGKR